MWLVLFIIALLFVLGHAFFLLRAKHRLPDNVKAQPYSDDEDD